MAEVTSCLICERVALAKEGRNPHLIAEMDYTFFVVGDHQFHEGYAVVLLKEHVREPFDLAPHVQREHFAEVMRAAQALQRTFQPWKLNFSCYGNAEPHVHWHVVPRYEGDPHLRRDPWREVERFSEKTITADEAREIAARIRQNFE
jgi:diadenosine tetraphosphate (Ap4A) HIT family hydrolase